MLEFLYNMAYIGTIEEKNKSATSGRRLKTSVQTTQPTIPPIQTSGFSVNVPNTIPSSVLGSNISSGQISNVFNNYLAQQQELMGQITANSVASPEEAAVRNALTNFDQSYRLGMDKIENKPIAMPFITGQQAALQRQAAIERQGLAETYSALSSDRKAKVDALQNQFSMLSNLYGTSVDAIKTQAEFDQLAREAEKIDTSIVKLDNGNTLLIDNQTGKVVKNFGGAEGVGSLSGDGGVGVGSSYRQTAASNVLDYVDKAISQVKVGTAGLGSNILAAIPGTGAKNLRETINTVKGNIGFEALQAMREASKTGGALGQIAVQELETLQTILGSLNANQSRKQLLENLGYIKSHYTAATDALNMANSVSPSQPQSGQTQVNANDPLGIF